MEPPSFFGRNDQVAGEFTLGTDEAFQFRAHGLVLAPRGKTIEGGGRFSIEISVEISGGIDLGGNLGCSMEISVDHLRMDHLGIWNMDKNHPGTF